MRQIIAFGGGGFSMEPENPLLDWYILRQAKKESPRIYPSALELTRKRTACKNDQGVEEIEMETMYLGREEDLV